VQQLSGLGAQATVGLKRCEGCGRTISARGAKGTHCRDCRPLPASLQRVRILFAQGLDAEQIAIAEHTTKGATNQRLTQLRKRGALQDRAA
jgi:hypothetical protein